MGRPALDGYRWRLVAGQTDTGPYDFTPAMASRLETELHGGFDAVAGYNRLGYLYAIRCARRLGRRVIHCWETTLEERRPWIRRLVKRVLFRWLIRPEDHGLAYGSRSWRYLEQAGVSASRLHLAPYCADTHLTDRAWPRRDELRARLRAERGIGASECVFLFSGKLVANKDPLRLLEAFRRASLQAHLVYVGAGHLGSALRSAARDDHRIHLLGFRNQTELPAIYAAADILVLPSHSEPWGVVVNEAMAMGCAVIVSERAGSSADLVEGRDTGLVVPPGDTVRLTAALREAVADPERLRLWRDNSRRVIASHTPTRAAAAIREAVWAE